MAVAAAGAGGGRARAGNLARSRPVVAERPCFLLSSWSSANTPVDRALNLAIACRQTLRERERREGRRPTSPAADTQRQQPRSGSDGTTICYGPLTHPLGAVQCCMQPQARLLALRSYLGTLARATFDEQRRALVDTHRLCCLRGRHCAESPSATAKHSIAIETEASSCTRIHPSL